MPIYNGMLPAIDKAEVKRYAGLLTLRISHKIMLTKHVRKSSY